MARFLKSRARAKGAAPGSMIFLGRKKMESTRIRLIRYSVDGVQEGEFDTLDEALARIDDQGICWLNIDGLHDTALIRRIGTHFNISELILENVLNTGQRPRMVEDENHVALITKAIYLEEEEKRVSFEQISFVFNDTLLISFQEKVGDHFDPVRQRIRVGKGKVRKRRADYLAYILIDSLVDNILINTEVLGDGIESLERRLDSSDREVAAEIFHYKTEIAFLRKTIRPLKETVTRVLRSDAEFLHGENQVFFQELYDLVDQAQDAAETYHNLVNDHLNLYHTNVSNRANDVMKVLTIFASIFIPLTFIAGIYGTNFDYVPELHFKYSYFVMWFVMLAVAVGMLVVFRKKKWF